MQLQLSILQIKMIQIKDPEKIANVEAEIAALTDEFEALLVGERKYELNALYNQLIQTNLDLWQIEDDLRLLEKEKSFGSEFIHKARLVYKTNDQRAILKRQINEMTDSELVEEKDYEEY